MYEFELTAFVIAGTLAALAGTVHQRDGRPRRIGKPMRTDDRRHPLHLGRPAALGRRRLASLPGVLRLPQPLFLLGALFMVVVAVLQGGLTRPPRTDGRGARERTAWTGPPEVR